MAGFFVSISEEAERRGGSATTAFGILQVSTARSQTDVAWLATARVRMISSHNNQSLSVDGS